MKLTKSLIRPGKKTIFQASPILSWLTVAGAVGIFLAIYFVGIPGSIPQLARITIGILMAVVTAIGGFFGIDFAVQVTENNSSREST